MAGNCDVHTLDDSNALIIPVSTELEAEFEGRYVD